MSKNLSPVLYQEKAIFYPTNDQFQSTIKNTLNTILSELYETCISKPYTLSLASLDLALEKDTRLCGRFVFLMASAVLAIPLFNVIFLVTIRFFIPSFAAHCDNLFKQNELNKAMDLYLKQNHVTSLKNLKNWNTLPSEDLICAYVDQFKTEGEILANISMELLSECFIKYKKFYSKCQNEYKLKGCMNRIIKDKNTLPSDDFICTYIDQFKHANEILEKISPEFLAICLLKNKKFYSKCLNEEKLNLCFFFTFVDDIDKDTKKYYLTKIIEDLTKNGQIDDAMDLYVKQCCLISKQNTTSLKTLRLWPILPPDDLICAYIDKFNTPDEILSNIFPEFLRDCSYSLPKFLKKLSIEEKLWKCFASYPEYLADMATKISGFGFFIVSGPIGLMIEKDDYRFEIFDTAAQDIYNWILSKELTEKHLFYIAYYLLRHNQGIKEIPYNNLTLIYNKLYTIFQYQRYAACFSFLLEKLDPTKTLGEGHKLISSYENGSLNGFFRLIFSDKPDLTELKEMLNELTSEEQNRANNCILIMSQIRGTGISHDLLLSN